MLSASSTKFFFRESVQKRENQFEKCYRANIHFCYQER